MSAERRQFVDTNVLVYGYDESETAKQDIAWQLVEELGLSRRLTLSIQVLQELYVTLARRLPDAGGTEIATAAVRRVSAHHVHRPSPPDVHAAIELSTAARISFWDAMLVRSASEMSCDVLWTEDLTHGQVIAGVQIRDPFRD